MLWKFYINGTEIEEPQGWTDVTFRVQRDQTWHGIMIEASTSQLTFYGNGFRLLKELKETDGVDADAQLLVEVKCEGQQEYEEAFNGKLNFKSYRERCGDQCSVSMNVDQGGCATIFKARFDQKVDMDSPVAFDGTTPLPSYDALNKTILLPTQELPISAEAYVAQDGDGTNLDFAQLFDEDKVLIRPVYGNVIDNSVVQGNLDQVANFFQDPDNYFFLTPQLLFEDAEACTYGAFSYNIKLNGSITPTWALKQDDAEMNIRLIVDRWNGTGARTTVHTYDVVLDASKDTTYTFNQSWTSTISLNQGEGLYAYIEIEILFGSSVLPAFVATDIVYNFNRLTSFNLNNTKECPPTEAGVYLIHETLSRLAEAATDGCMTAKSDYYGRTDSLPYTAPVDGCGSLRAITNGLKIRQAEDRRLFISAKEALDGLRAIDNIGFTIEGNTLIVEDVKWFYKDEELLSIDAIPNVETTLEEQLIYSSITGGYEKWQTQSIKGIDEFNSQKDYRTSVKTVSSPLDIRSKFIASGYIIENLRVTTLLNSGDANTTYDNDIFILQLTRDGSTFEVEQGEIGSPSNIFSSTTIYNWRLRPLYNLMRWFKSIGRKVFFAAGTGNYEASGINTSDCVLESQVLPEDSDIDESVFADAQEAEPIWETDSIQFEAPLSVREYNDIKANPYGYISVQCGNGDYKKGYIRSIDYKPKDGQATFNLIKKWQSV